MRLGSTDRWSDEGNKSQLLTRRAIGAVLHELTPPADELPAAYHAFIENLRPNDIILSLNYDLILETLLRHHAIPFRRFLNRFKSVDGSSGILNLDAGEVILLKLHGSLDWIDDRRYLLLRESLDRQGLDHLRAHPVLDNPERFDLESLVDDLLLDDDLLRHIHQMGNVDAFYAHGQDLGVPFILSPSYYKLVYAQPILSLWDGLGSAGSLHNGISIIGFSLPAHDEYLRVALYRIISNYSHYWTDNMLGPMKDFIRFVDLRTSDEAEQEYKEKYRFANPEHSKFHFRGFDEDAITFLFDEGRET